jgi:hypothetical protein
MDFLPEVKMDYTPSDDETVIDEKEDIKEEVEDFNQEKDSDPNETCNIKLVEDDIPKAKSKRDDMDVNDIFNMPDNANVKLTKKGKPRKKRPPMTEEQKQKLALAREKANKVRKQKAAEKLEQKKLDNEEKELLKKQRQKKVKQLKEEVESDEPMQPQQTTGKALMFSKQDLEDAQLNAIINYEKIRKERKKEKQERLKKEKEQEQIKNTLRRAVQPQQEYNPFNGCY